MAPQDGCYFKMVAQQPVGPAIEKRHRAAKRGLKEAEHAAVPGHAQAQFGEHQRAKHRQRTAEPPGQHHLARRVDRQRHAVRREEDAHTDDATSDDATDVEGGQFA